MSGAINLLTPGGGKAIIQPASSIASDVTVNVPSVNGTLVSTGSTAQVSQAMLAAGVAGNGPAFSAYKSSNQTISNNTETKVTFDTESYDTASCFSSSTFTPNVAGYYHFTCSLPIAASANRQFSFFPSLKKNGVAVYNPEIGQNISSSLDRGYVDVKMDVYANGTTDYFEIYFSSYDFTTSASVTISSGSTKAQFSAFLARAA